jgi:thioesterase domain-containing protein/acyl carrier protein
MEDFLAKLGLEVCIEECRAEQLARVSQLTLRTNQFNSTTIRRTEPQLASLLASGTRSTVVSVKDRFGDYGLVGALLWRRDSDRLRVDSFLLSCRALGRGVEHRMVAYLGQAAIESGLASVAIEFARSAKNTPAMEFLSSLPADRSEDPGEQKVIYRLSAAAAAALKFDGSVPQQSETREEPKGITATEALAERGPALAGIAAEWLELGDVRRALSATASDPTSVFEYQDGSEETIAGFLAAALNRARVGPEEDFFDLGGDSLLAVQVFAEIERRFDKALSIATLFDARTARALARLVRTESHPQYVSLIPIQPEGALAPLYCIHAAGGNVLFYGGLARWLGKDQPVYGLQAVGLAKKRKPHTRVEDMAAHYIGEILTFQSQGPYHLCGSSFGGLVAFEMARQMHAAGHDVGLVALLDTYGPGYPNYRSGLSRACSRLLLRIQTHYINLRPMNWSERLSYIRRKADKAKRLARRHARQGGNDFMRQFYQKTGRELPAHLVVAQNAIETARRSYSPQFYDGPVTLLRAATQPSGIVPDPALGWNNLAHTLAIHEIRGTHGAVTVDPHARGTADVLSQCLSEAGVVKHLCAV